MKTNKQEPPPEKRVEFSNAYTLKGNALHPFITDQQTAAKIAQDKQSLEKKFKSEKELSELVLKNGKILFGEQTLTVDYKSKIGAGFPGGFLPEGLLFDLKDPGKPKLYIMQIMLAEQNLAHLFLRMTCLFSFFKNEENKNRFAQTLESAIRKNIGWRNQLKPAFGSKGVEEFLQELLRKSPAVLLIMDSFKQELTGLMETYTETWGKVKPVLFRKFSINGSTIFTMTPTFAELKDKANGKEQKVKSTEEDHLENVSATVQEIFLQIKAEMLKADSAIEFRVKKFYISLRKNRNLAFFQLGKKKLSIVIANPEKTASKQIKHHKVLTLAESVKKFWNGNEHCFTVVIESKEHLSEIMQLLKKIVANGKSEEKKSDVTAPETPKAAHSEVKKAKTGKTSSQAKPKRKSKK